MIAKRTRRAALCVLLASFIGAPIIAGAEETETFTRVADDRPRVIVPKVIKTYPHQRDAFTQGLLFAEGAVVESTGRYGQSRLRFLDLGSGEPINEYRFPRSIFAEGATYAHGKLVALSYRSGRGFVFDPETLKQVDGFRYEGEGWGLTFDGEALIMSNGSPELRFLDAVTYKEKRTLTVTFNGQPIAMLNELEFVEGFIWANVWQQDFIIRIDPKTGIVDQIADLRGLYPAEDRQLPSEHVLNGIAYNPSTRQFLVTGKNWPNIFEIALPVEKSED